MKNQSIIDIHNSIEKLSEIVNTLTSNINAGINRMKFNLKAFNILIFIN